MRVLNRIPDKKLYNSVGVNAMLMNDRLRSRAKNSWQWVDEEKIIDRQATTHELSSDMPDAGCIRHKESGTGYCS